MSAVMKQQLDLWKADQEERWNAVVNRDARRDGDFVFAVSSTKIYCRPSCPSKRPRRDRVSFFEQPELAERAGFRACLRCRPREPETIDPQVKLAQQVSRLIEQSDGEPVTLSALSQKLGVSSFHLQRVFKSVMGITPKEFAETQRVNRFKQAVRAGEAIANATYDAGFGSSSRLYESASANLGMTPATYGKGGRGAVINYTIVSTPLGRLLVAATSKGVCSVMLGDSDEKLHWDLLHEFPAAQIVQNRQSLAFAANAIVDHLKNRVPHIDLPLDIRATAFQRQVWEQLRAIPLGQTLSYSDVAHAIGHDKAVRAVARACATNPVALVIPCHRVIREDKSLGGYRWGIERKKKLLERESTVNSEQ